MDNLRLALAHQVDFTESNFKAVADISSVPRALLPTVHTNYPNFDQSNKAEMDVPNDLTENGRKLLERLHLSQEDINKLEKETQEQSESTRWKDERRHRFTTSNFHMISRRQ